jgi:hypothetical protein
MYNKNQPDNSPHRFTPESLVEYLNTSICETLNSFKEIPDYKQPRHVTDVFSLEELAEKYPTF